MRGGIPAFLLAGARCLRAALSGEAARRQRDGQRARQRAVTRSPVTRAARGQRDGQRENSAKRKTGSGQAARSSLSNRRKAPTHRHKKPNRITARKAAVNPSLCYLSRARSNLRFSSRSAVLDPRCDVGNRNPRSALRPRARTRRDVARPGVMFWPSSSTQRTFRCAPAAGASLAPSRFRALGDPTPPSARWSARRATRDLI